MRYVTNLWTLAILAVLASPLANAINIQIFTHSSFEDTWGAFDEVLTTADDVSFPMALGVNSLGSSASFWEPDPVS